VCVTGRISHGSLVCTCARGRLIARRNCTRGTLQKTERATGCGMDKGGGVGRRRLVCIAGHVAACTRGRGRRGVSCSGRRGVVRRRRQGIFILLHMLELGLLVPLSRRSAQGQKEEGEQGQETTRGHGYAWKSVGCFWRTCLVVWFLSWKDAKRHDAGDGNEQVSQT